jgi:tetratricopeptide (TPR) repeat protein
MMKLGKLTGAHVIFTGSYLVSNSRIRVHARLVNVETGKVESSTKIDGTLNGIFDLQDKVVFTLMGETEKITIADIKPVKFTSEDKKKIEEKPKTSVTAYEWYAKGLEIRDTNPKEALTNFKKALDIDPNYTDALMSAGTTAGYTLNLFSEALGYLEKAERIFNGHNETKSSNYASLMLNIGLVYRSKGQLDRALEYYLNSQSIYGRLGLQNTANYASLMLNIGNVYRSKGQLDRALEYHLNSQSIKDRLGLQNTANYANLMYGMAVLYETKGQRDMAGRYFRMAYDTYVRADYSGEWRDKALNNARRLGY